MEKQNVSTDHAPKAIGTYSQAIIHNGIAYLSGQIGLDPATMTIPEDIDAQIHQVLNNLRAVAVASGGSLNDIVKVTVYLTDLNHFGRVNDMMAEYFLPPYPARATVEVSALPRGALVEMDGILALPE
jgi:reactive intermediate/imine deaminase